MATKNCNQCEKTFASASSLSHHKRSHDQTKKDTCELCGKTFASASSLSHHKRSHDQTTKDTCDLCDQFFRKNNLKRHKEYCKNVIFDSEKKIFNCDICRMEFDAEKYLNQHSQVHAE